MVESIAILPHLQVLFGRYDIMCLITLGKKDMGIIMKKMLSLALTVATILGVTSGCKKKLPKFELEVGDTIEFGTYEDEPIEWEVKHRNFVVGENKVIVEFQSTCAIECLPFNEDGEASWEDCTLREWLNNDFYEDAFSKSEKKQIIDNTYSMYMGDARWLTDKVYLSNEYLRYRLKPGDATCKPTKHAKKQGIRMEGGSCMYWTLDVVNATSASQGGKNTTFPICLGTSKNNAGSSNGPDELNCATDVGVRPWISLEYEATFEMKDIETCDRVTFGTYDEDPITWVVIDSDKNGVNLLSKYGLEKMKMDKDADENDFTKTDLHDWLNDDFYEEAFNKSDKKLIVADDDDDNVTLIEKISIKDGFDRECMYELLLGCGYSRAYCEENDIPDRDVMDTFWCKGVSDKNDKLMVFSIAKISGGGTDSDQEFSVRPMITIKF